MTCEPAKMMWYAHLFLDLLSIYSAFGVIHVRYHWVRETLLSQGLDNPPFCTKLEEEIMMFEEDTEKLFSHPLYQVQKCDKV